ncbi:dienelactone hydrolase family protein [Phormidium sp. LEGE 05292]|uniref:alpha/beta hydrolase n=1 Tax=[Phormidium] sp. LEGE 05292 TaxID=767427 RepID=UPI00187E976B|nr:dienelactone hydrolase family protein [Phormidium sp. LEGE 05292]MBE9224989.1 dienelactone hydrolase family protein [Phormidium sp. LEGE 05292]
MSLQVISIPPTTGQAPTGVIVALHGWGANAEDLADLAPFLNLPDYQFLFPNAPFPHPYSSVGRAWYDFQRNEGIQESRQLLTDWLSALESETGVPLSRTILSGFSQGGAMTLDVGLKLPLAGLVSLSGYLHPITQGIKPDAFPPTLIVHGTKDSIVPITAGQNARDTLTNLGVAVQYQEFNMAHEVIPAVLNLMRSFVLQVMSVESSKA